MPYIADIVNVLIFSFLGIILMIVGNMIIDQFIPGDFPTEIKKGNSAVAWVCAGSFIGMGEIVRTAIQSPTAAEVEEFLLHGIAVFLMGFFFISAFQRKYSLSKEIMSGNVAAGIVTFGIFVGLALVVAGAIQ